MSGINLLVNGVKVEPNSTSPKVEIVPNSCSTYSGAFFKAGGVGHVEIAGVTDSGYHLVSPHPNTAFDILKEDAFNGRVQIDGVSVPYCKPGRAPLGQELYTGVGAALSNITSELLITGGYWVLTDNEQAGSQIDLGGRNKRVLTIYLQGAGGGGAWGSSGWGWAGGSGGGGAGAALISMVFHEDVGDLSTFKIKFTLGHRGAVNNNSSATRAGTTSLSITFPDIGEVTPIVIEGGQSGASTNDSAGLPGEVTLTEFNSSYVTVTEFGKCDGGRGYYTKAAEGSGIWYPRNWTVMEKWPNVIGGKQGGTKGYQGGGGGASPSHNGADAETQGESGAGGGGGDGAFVSGEAGKYGGNSFFTLYY